MSDTPDHPLAPAGPPPPPPAERPAYSRDGQPQSDHWGVPPETAAS